MRHLPIIFFLVILSACNLNAPTPQNVSPTSSAQSVDGEPRLVVAWVTGGNLMVWQTGDSIPRRVASGGAIEPFIAPDGQHVAFTRGANGAPQTLWVVDILGTAEQEIVGERPRNYQPGTHHIGAVAWLNETTLYFNTLVQAGGPAFRPQNDLYQANIRTRDVDMILAEGEGGRISISPNRQKIVVTYPGTYGQQDGKILVVDPFASRDPHTLLTFVGVATGSERSFYPSIFWLPDNSAVLTAIPDSDLIYADDSAAFEIPETRLWLLPIDNPTERSVIGSLRISFFGLPRWSSTGESMTFMRRTAGTNDFTVYVADVSGEDAQALFAGRAGTIEQPQWIPDSNDFLYARSEPDGSFVYYLDGLTREAEPLSDETIFLPHFVTHNSYVYVAEGVGRLEMRFKKFGDEPLFIGSVGESVPLFDAVLVFSY